MITWRDGQLADASCPACGDARPKREVLEVGTLGSEPRLVTLVACDTCTLHFFPAITAPLNFDEDANGVSAASSFEAAVGLRGSVDCLARIDTSSVRRFLEIGCGTGLTLDYARHVYGWDVLGVDTSAMSRMADRELGLPIVNALLGQTDEVADGGWDLAFACEVIEHVPDPAAFLGAVRRALTHDGVFLLRTPAAEGLDPQRQDGSMLASLAPGYHTMIHTLASLEATLRAAGFEHVSIQREGDTLHAAASNAPLSWDPDGVLDAAELERYLRERSEQLPRDSAARLGLLQQLANQLVNAGNAEGAAGAVAELDVVLTARHGCGVDSAPAEVPAFVGALVCAAFMARAALLRLQGDLRAAEDRYAAAAEVARQAKRTLDSVNACDPSLEINARLADRQRFALAAIRDPDAARPQLDMLLADAGPERATLVAELLITCGAAGAYSVVAQLADEAKAQLEPAVTSPRENELRWALAMMNLNHLGDHGEAARQFAAAARAASTAQTRWAARYHEAYSLFHGGDRDRARPLLEEVLKAGAAAGEWAVQARSLLAYSG